MVILILIADIIIIIINVSQLLGSKASDLFLMCIAEMDEESLALIVSSLGTKAQSVHAALWNLDRVDQRELPLNNEFRYGAHNVVGTGQGVSVFILDSGIRPSHQEFAQWGTGETRAKYG